MANLGKCQDLARVVLVLVTRCPHCAFWPFCFPLFPVIICNCASFPLIVFKPLVFLISLLCVWMLAPSPSDAVNFCCSSWTLLWYSVFVLVDLFLIIFWGFFLLYLPPCGFTFFDLEDYLCSLGITFDVVDLYFCLKNFPFNFIKTQSQ